MTATQSESAAQWSPLVDTHAHVFLRELPLAQYATHRPTQSFTAEQYVKVLDAANVRYGVITAPSFLGTYNDYTLQALRRQDRLRGTAIVDADADPYLLRALANDGIVGIRYSLRRYPNVPDFTAPDYRRLLRRVQDLDWYVHLLAESEKLTVLVPLLAESGVKLVIDHFGVPDRSFADDLGLRAIFRAIENGRTWIKLSAPYRTTGADMKALARKFLAAAGAERLLWGSDWPWTSYENRFTYRDTIRWLEEWIPDRAIRDAIDQTGLALHGFAASHGNG